MIQSRLIDNEFLRFTYSQLDSLRAKDAEKSNLLKKILFLLNNDEENILAEVNIVKSYLDDFTYFTPVFKHNKNFNINLVIR